MNDQPIFYVPERALVIAAHADDIEFGAAGTVARWTEAGSAVTFCLVTDGGAGSNDPNTDLKELVETRKREQIAAAEILGVKDVRFLGYPDGMLQPTLELRRDLTRLIREIRPQVVITLDPTTILFEAGNYINHPDHRAAGEAALYAVFPSAGTRPIFPELLAEGFEPHNVGKLYLTLTEHPNTFVDVTNTHEVKLAALRCHVSQIGDNDLGFIRQWDAEAGKTKGFMFAEAFRVLHFDLQPPGAEDAAPPVPAEK